MYREGWNFDTERVHERSVLQKLAFDVILFHFSCIFFADFRRLTVRTRACLPGRAGVHREIFPHAFAER